MFRCHNTLHSSPACRLPYRESRQKILRHANYCSLQSAPVLRRVHRPAHISCRPLPASRRSMPHAAATPYRANRHPAPADCCPTQQAAAAHQPALSLENKPGLPNRLAGTCAPHGHLRASWCNDSYPHPCAIFRASLPWSDVSLHSYSCTLLRQILNQICHSTDSPRTHRNDHIPCLCDLQDSQGHVLNIFNKHRLVMPRHPQCAHQ